MPFDKTFFDNLGNLLRAYLKTYPCGAVTVTLKAYGTEYHLNELIQVDQRVITFSHYDENKSASLPEWKERPTAWPALTIPYEVIESVEFNPSVPGKGANAAGFKLEPDKGK